MNKKRNMRELRRVIFCYLIIVFLICKKTNIYAERENFYEFASDFSRYVTLEDIYDLNEQYRETPELDKEEAVEFLMKRAEKDGRNIEYEMDGEDADIIVDVLVDDDIGYIQYYISSFLPFSSSLSSSALDSDENALFLCNTMNEEYFCLSGSKEELDDFIEQNNKSGEYTKFVCDYVRENLEDDDYAGVARNEDKEPVVLLADEGKADILEKQGIAWESAGQSKEEMYEDIQYLWDNREELKITYAEIDHQKLVIRGLYSEEEFDKRMQDKNAGIEDYVYYYSFDYCQFVEGVKDIENRSDLNHLFYFLLVKKNDPAFVHYKDEFWNELEVWMEDMKKAYPEYTYDNLFTLGYLSRDRENYLELDAGLEKFLNAILYMENNQNAFEEEKFGDPKHLAIGVLMKEYRIMYPEMDYEQIYNTYVKEINENSTLTQEEKRNRYEWEIHKMQKKQHFEEGENVELRKTEVKNQYTAIFGGAVLIFGCIVVYVMKKNRYFTCKEK